MLNFNKKILILGFFLNFFLSEICALDRTASRENPWKNYYTETLKEPVDEFVSKAFELVQQETITPLVILNLGIGSGSNIQDILKQDVEVHAYDAVPESIEILNKRFRLYINNKLHLHQVFFEDLHSLPKADMIIAWRSLSFMEKDKFFNFWKNINISLKSSGIFVGTFFGKKHYLNRSPKRPQLFRMSSKEVTDLFKNFKILYLYKEIKYNKNLSKSRGVDSYSDIYKIIAKRI